MRAFALAYRVHLTAMFPLSFWGGWLAEQQKALSLEPRFVNVAPLPGIPGITIDSMLDGRGIAQPMARNRGLQARIIWIDGTANIDRYNSADKIIALVNQIKAAGFNTVVFDVKPISGQVIYPSAIAPRLSEWKGKVLPSNYDPLAKITQQVKAAGMSMLVSLNAFSEGHSLFKVGPGYEQPAHQTVVYVPKPVLAFGGGARYPLAAKLDIADPNSVSVFTSSAKLPPSQAGAFAITIRKNGRIQDGFEFGGAGNGIPSVPSGGSILYGTGTVADFLRQNCHAGDLTAFDTDATFRPMAEVGSAQEGTAQIPLMMNPNDPSVRGYELSIAREVVGKYPVDGILYDDRLRYAGIDADFSPLARSKFEAVVGQKLTWPDDVFKFTVNRNLTRGVRPGRFYDQWMAWRSSVIRDYLAEVRHAIRTVRPGTLLGMYAGSWYGDYPALGNNYASSKTEAGFWFMSPNYRKSGDAHLLDFIIPGCYYTTATIHEAMTKNVGIGASVEAAGRTVNSLVRDQAWTYAGLSLIDFKDDPDGLQNCLQAACASTEGVMIFDLSHDIESMWPVFARAFAQPARPPHMQPDLLTELRRRREQLDKLGKNDPPIVITGGSSGIGQ